jgi:hypothetical protein
VCGRVVCVVCAGAVVLLQPATDAVSSRALAPRVSGVLVDLFLFPVTASVLHLLMPRWAGGEAVRVTIKILVLIQSKAEGHSYLINKVTFRS